MFKTIDDLKSERAWLLQHGMLEKCRETGSFTAAVNALEKEIGELNKEIRSLEMAENN